MPTSAARAIDPKRAQDWGAGVKQLESAHTTHMTAADAFGNVVATTQTINNLFGAKIHDPRPRRGAEQLHEPVRSAARPRAVGAPGKRVTTSMSPMMALRDGKIAYALGLPGGKRIFPSAFQALVNLIDHGMSLQEAVEAPRVWTEGNALEVELAVPDGVRAALEALGHRSCAVGHRRRRHERHRLPRRRHHVRRSLLARRRHADRPRRRPGEARRAVRDRAIISPANQILSAVFRFR